MSRAHLVFFCCALLVTGCARPIDTAILSANAAGVTLDAAHEVLASRYRADQLAALARVHPDASKAEKVERVGQVRKAYAPVWFAYNAARQAWLNLAQGIRAAMKAEAAGQTPEQVQLVLLSQSLSRSLIDLTKAGNLRSLDL